MVWILNCKFHSTRCKKRCEQQGVGFAIISLLPFCQFFRHLKFFCCSLHSSYLLHFRLFQHLLFSLFLILFLLHYFHAFWFLSNLQIAVALLNARVSTKSFKLWSGPVARPLISLMLSKFSLIAPLVWTHILYYYKSCVFSRYMTFLS